MHQPKSMISNYANVPKLPLNRKSNVGNKSKNSKKEQSIEITTSIGNFTLLFYFNIQT